MTIDHISYSQYNSYVTCPRSWYLSKIKKAEEKQTWYMPIGTAVHRMIEDEIGGGVVMHAEDYFYPLISAQMQIEPDLSKWMAGGSVNAPVTEGLALQQVKDCFSRALEYLDEIDVWEVEYDASGRLPGLSVPVKAYPDIIGEHKKHGPVIPDWKTGSQKPKDNFQLETYAALLRSAGYPNGSQMTTESFKGLWLMLKPGASKARPIDLSGVDPLEVGKKYQKVYDQMQRKLYPTRHAGYKCKFCFNQDNCLLQAGPTERAKYYDRAYEDGVPF